MVAATLDILEVALLHGAEHRSLAVEVEVEGALGDAGLARNVVHRRASVPELPEQQDRRVKDGLGLPSGLNARTVAHALFNVACQS